MNMASLNRLSFFAARTCVKNPGLQVVCQQIRYKSSENGDDLFTDNGKPLVGLTADGCTYVCWHPESSFPYEFSKPIIRKKTDLEMGDSHLKVQHLLEEKLKLRPHGPTDNELANMFFTSKHRWNPKPEKKYRKPNPPKDRERI